MPKNKFDNFFYDYFIAYFYDYFIAYNDVVFKKAKYHLARNRLQLPHTNSTHQEQRALTT